MALAELDLAIAQHLAAIHRAAATSPAGGGPAWDALMRHYGIAPLDGNERAAIVNGMRLSSGAVPAEVRMVFGGLETWARAELDRLRRDPATAASPPFVGLVERLQGLADRETATYERSIGVPPPAPAPVVAAPPPAAAAPSLAAIFANAQETAKEVPWANAKYKNVGALNCVHCGGPQERPADFMCKYCRRPIAGSIKPNT